MWLANDFRQAEQKNVQEIESRRLELLSKSIIEKNTQQKQSQIDENFENFLTQHSNLGMRTFWATTD